MKNVNGKVRILGVIPARGGSKSIPHKNIALLSGKPLIYYTIQEAKKSKLLDAFVVSTDDAKIARVSSTIGADVPFLRPKRYAQDRSPDIEFLEHALKWLKFHRGWEPEIVVILRPTSPLRTSREIDGVIRFILKTRCDSVKSVSLPYPYNPFKMWFLDSRTKKMKPILPTPYFKKLGTDVPRQLLPTVYWQNGLVDATRAKFIKRGRVFGPDMRGFITDPRLSVDVDSVEDLKRAAPSIKRFKYP